MRNKKFIKGAIVIAVGGFIAKLLGAFYRIPLTNIIGGYGIGLYQMVYPFYCLLLTVSATGIPSSVAEMVARKRGDGVSDEGLLKCSLKLFLVMGITGTVLMIGLSPLLSTLQGNKQLVWSYIALSPSVFLVSAISVFRGWFQGRMNMYPTAISEVIEQIVKVGVGLVFAYIFRDNVEKAVNYILLAVSISELVAFIFMYMIYRRVPVPFKGLKEDGKIYVRNILKISIPVTLSSALIPLSSLLDSVIIVRLLGQYTENSIVLFGLFSGGAITIINLPVSICYGIAAVSISDVASESNKISGNMLWRKVLYSLAITLVVAIPMSFSVFFFASPIVKIIFSSLNSREAFILVNLIKICSISALTLSCVQTLSACLTGLGKPIFSAISMGTGIVIKIILEFFLIPNKNMNIYGAAIALDVCYLVAFILDLVYNFIITKRKCRNNDHGSRVGC